MMALGTVLNLQAGFDISSMYITTTGGVTHVYIQTQRKRQRVEGERMEEVRRYGYVNDEKTALGQSDRRRAGEGEKTRR